MYNLKLSFKQSNIFFTFFYKTFLRYLILKKLSCGSINRMNLNKKVQKRGDVKKNISNINKIYFNFINLILNNFNKSLFIIFKLYVLNIKYLNLIKKTLIMLNKNKIRFNYIILYSFAHNGCRLKRKKKKV